MKRRTFNADHEQYSHYPITDALLEVKNHKLPDTLSFTIGLMQEIRRKFQENFPDFEFSSGNNFDYSLPCHTVFMPGSSTLRVVRESTADLKNRRIVVYHDEEAIAEIPNKDANITDKIVSRVMRMYKKRITSTNKQLLTNRS